MLRVLANALLLDNITVATMSFQRLNQTKKALNKVLLEHAGIPTVPK